MTGTKYEIVFDAILNDTKLMEGITRVTSVMRKTDFNGYTQTSITGLTESGQSLTRTLDDASGKIIGTTTRLNVMKQSIGDIILKVGKFAVATAVIGGFTTAVAGAVQAVTDLDDSLTQFKKVSDLRDTGLDDYVKQLSDLGDSVARTTDQMVQNATIFKQAGYSDEDSAKLAKLGAEYQNIADSEITAQEAGSFLVSQMKAYNLDADEAVGILDQLNEVSNNYAVSSSDIATGLTKSASAMANLGNSSEETIGLLTAGTEQLTGQAGKVAKGLQTIGINISQLAQKSDTLTISVGGQKKQIELLDKQTGDMLSTYDVLKQISKYWDDMTDSEKTAVAASQAGKMSCSYRFNLLERCLYTSAKLWWIPKDFNTKL